ncbi:hypothetical protein SLEP1_g28552 [Rubroshorea leprosula]|uniref:Uncharacterized protein n=1 Tax=Rubroshorea leprosula TaxID=152421 RepID=A0AAV5K4V0_9ROSI|nr:hypothetical protein SLEP1_g28552 [Rubroshorea leprosula]
MRSPIFAPSSVSHILLLWPSVTEGGGGDIGGTAQSL